MLYVVYVVVVEKKDDGGWKGATRRRGGERGERRADSVGDRDSECVCVSTLALVVVPICLGR